MDASKRNRASTLLFLLVELVLLQQQQQGADALALDAAEVSALRDIRNCLNDLPGSSFFQSWNFAGDACKFTGVVCCSFGDTNHVTMLSLGSGLAGSAGLSGKLSASIGNLRYLRSLAVVPGAVKGRIPSTLSNLKDLQFLGISKNRLTGCIPQELGSLYNLQGLDLSYNILTGGLPDAIARLPNLNTLTLSHNALTGSIPAFTAPIFHLDLQRNCFNGGLPSLPGTITYLSLSRNSLSGPIYSLAGLAKLGFLDLSFNSFTGSIPSEIFSFKMSDLLLQRNKLSGAISVGPGGGSIPMIDLSYNLLTGSPPAGLSFAHKLFLNNNKLSGAVPQEFVDAMVFGDLQVLYLQHNYVHNIDMTSSLPLPATCTFCIQYNCLSTPPQSSCPLNVGRQSSRPIAQCNNFHY